MKGKSMEYDNRTPAQIKEHYEIEKALAGKLRSANKQERRHLYSSLYNELYQRVPLHPQLTRKLSPADSQLAVAAQMRFLKSVLHQDMTFMEVGPGDCALSFEVTKYVSQVYAVDVSDEITKAVTVPANFKLILSDGSGIPLPANSVNIAYSNQLMEHLHPDDALEQLQNLYNALAPGGLYVCITPNRLSGPHDVSQHFDAVATGFHLKEYTTEELSKLFKQVGFSRVKVNVGIKGHYANFPVFPIALCEKILNLLPHGLSNMIARNLPMRLLLSTRVIGVK
jgi:SAM-dependent methyltransferase